MKIVTLLLCLSLAAPLAFALPDDAWLESLNAEVNAIIDAREDIRALRRLEANINDSNLIDSLLVKIKQRVNTATQAIKDLAA